MKPLYDKSGLRIKREPLVFACSIPFALVCAGVIYFIISELKLAWISNYSFLLIGVSYILPVSIGIATSIRSDKKTSVQRL